MRTILYTISFLLLVSAPMPAQAQGRWHTLHRHSAAIVQIDTIDVQAGPNGGTLVNILTIYNDPPPRLENGQAYKYSATVVEYDCRARKSWLHRVFYGYQRETVGQQEYDTPQPMLFLPPGTLGGDTALNACTHLSLRGIR